MHPLILCVIGVQQNEANVRVSSVNSETAENQTQSFFLGKEHWHRTVVMLLLSRERIAPVSEWIFCTCQGTKQLDIWLQRQVFAAAVHRKTARNPANKRDVLLCKGKLGTLHQRKIMSITSDRLKSEPN